MNNELTLRDQFALSMPHEAIPTIEDRKTINIMASKLGLEWGG